MTATPSACSRSIAGGLEAVPVAQPLGDEVHDFSAEHLERPAQDDGRRDAVDVVVAVNRDALAGGQSRASSRSIAGIIPVNLSGSCR